MEAIQAALRDPVQDMYAEMSRLMIAGIQPDASMYAELARLMVAGLQPAFDEEARLRVAGIQPALDEEALPDSTVVPFAGHRRRLETSGQHSFTGSAHRLQ